MCLAILTVLYGLMQLIAQCLEHSGHRRRMQLTCRDWAAATTPSCTKLDITESEAKRQTGSLLGAPIPLKEASLNHCTKRCDGTL